MAPNSSNAGDTVTGLTLAVVPARDVRADDMFLNNGDAFLVTEVGRDSEGRVVLTVVMSEAETVAVERFTPAPTTAADTPEPTPAPEPTDRMHCRTFSATKRHIVNPNQTDKTLCGHRVALRERYVHEGQERVPERWMILDLPQCDRCERAATKRGI